MGLPTPSLNSRAKSLVWLSDAKRIAAILYDASIRIFAPATTSRYVSKIDLRFPGHVYDNDLHYL